ncbi:YtnP family quorum-quenching lactonase [Salisediminibacterium halotolerans]|uniref:YtnP family quorum-quenching lactonase n=1 Tax=Salisediminibacterium halotolerans TaxID=517425 RepID=UPI000EB53D1D|nr:MBL fold metallo-hydrolase [Salisediminibacterium halotolerans]RLJ69405.1 glyoxylase-like metal-dependent hydrolase (beta-lactamase superfamily II) [Actinophytocola xinjiangensis]RPE83969.1 glyoxylase-like metal-dependent hydrolase (beta-lactamase superfamily II) [Salisediminibacterium halotolerans]TWG32480.1 glyoxylase-like metal-dependent hydrolase (beta-lactamase superfamily II) [Salisediminibacterium halotolerans]GEL07679.1 putative quorum-quenching lactonase YtnP [Salisediminibacterium 
MLEQLTLSDNCRLTWLNGGVTHLDGGAMFGVVPKPLWSKKYPPNELNQIELRTDPILLEVDGKNYLIESGIGNGKFSDKAKKNFGITEESRLTESLRTVSLTPADIDGVLMTHMHFDHASGLTDGNGRSIFPNAVIWVQETEWNELQHPNIRSKSTYFEENWRGIAEQTETYAREKKIADGIRLIHTGGHSAGHAVIHIARGGQEVWHLADLLPTHAHKNPLWVMAFDDYPMDSIAQKQRYLNPDSFETAWFTFYHDACYRALKWSEDGKSIQQTIERNRDNE